MKASGQAAVHGVGAPTIYRFGDLNIHHTQVFLSRKHVYAMVNKKPATPQHVLVVPTRPVKRLHDLTELETLELFTCTREIIKRFEE